MKVLLYTASETGAASSIERWVQSIIPSEQLGICRSLQELEGNLCRQSTRCRLAIFHANSAEEMDHLLLLKHLLDDIRIILIVPDVTEETVQKGHRLYPRFMTDSNIDMNQLAAVIRKNIDYLNIKQSVTSSENGCAKKSLSGRKKQ